MNIRYEYDSEIDKDNLRDLFLSVRWDLGNSPDKLQEAFRNSHRIVTAWDGEKLIGLINSISDGALTAYIPYLLVKSDYQKQGLGKRLVEIILEGYKGYERVILLTDKDAVDFYVKCGFINIQSIHPMLIIHPKPETN